MVVKISAPAKHPRYNTTTRPGREGRAAAVAAAVASLGLGEARVPGAQGRCRGQVEGGRDRRPVYRDRPGHDVQVGCVVVDSPVVVAVGVVRLCAFAQFLLQIWEAGV